MRRRRRRMRAACRTTWSKTWIQRREGRGVYANLLREIEQQDPETFRQYHRFDARSFKKILDKVKPFIRKKDTVMRPSITSGERLSVTLSFLATGQLQYKMKNIFEQEIYLTKHGKVRIYYYLF